MRLLVGVCSDFQGVLEPRGGTWREPSLKGHVCNVCRSAGAFKYVCGSSEVPGTFAPRVRLSPRNLTASASHADTRLLYIRSYNQHISESITRQMIFGFEIMTTNTVDAQPFPRLSRACGKQVQQCSSALSAIHCSHSLLDNRFTVEGVYPDWLCVIFFFDCFPRSSSDVCDACC